MAKELPTIPFEEFSSNPVGVLERVIREHEAVVVETETGDRAILKPARSRKRQGRKITEADYEAFLSSAGGWKDLVDTEKLKEDIYTSRSISSRPPVEL